jgi:hypothetical protein
MMDSYALLHAMDESKQHTTRVKFSVGDYVDVLDCNVAPIWTWHLLLGRP